MVSLFRTVKIFFSIVSSSTVIAYGIPIEFSCPLNKIDRSLDQEIHEVPSLYSTLEIVEALNLNSSPKVVSVKALKLLVSEISE